MHAYLIMAHSNENQLTQLIETLDYPENDIYIHLDVKMGDVNIHLLNQAARYSKLKFVERKNVVWGHYSQIDCEFGLFRAALQGGDYEYVHLLSGMDLPLCSQKQIHDYFHRFKGKEFVHIESAELSSSDQEKYMYRFFLQKYIGNKQDSLLYYLQRISIHVQRILRIRKKSSVNWKMYKGANWVSITGTFMAFLISNEKRVKKEFRFSKCCDELFLQTVLMNSPYAQNLSCTVFQDDYRSCQRYIDWKRGNPYVFRKNDFEELISSGYLFARKFDSKVDSEIINKIVAYVKEYEYE